MVVAEASDRSAEHQRLRLGSLAQAPVVPDQLGSQQGRDVAEQGVPQCAPPRVAGEGRHPRGTPPGGRVGRRGRLAVSEPQRATRHERRSRNVEAHPFGVDESPAPVVEPNLDEPVRPPLPGHEVVSRPGTRSNSDAEVPQHAGHEQRVVVAGQDQPVLRLHVHRPAEARLPEPAVVEDGRHRRVAGVVHLRAHPCAPGAAPSPTRVLRMDQDTPHPGAGVRDVRGVGRPHGEPDPAPVVTVSSTAGC